MTGGSERHASTSFRVIDLETGPHSPLAALVKVTPAPLVVH